MLGCYSKSKYKWLFFFHCFVVYVFPFPFINTACSKGFINLLSNLLRDLCNLEIEIMYEMGSVLLLSTLKWPYLLTSEFKHVASWWDRIFEIKIILKNMECFIAKSRQPTQPSSYLGKWYTGEIIAFIKAAKWELNCHLQGF